MQEGLQWLAQTIQDSPATWSNVGKMAADAIGYTVRAGVEGRSDDVWRGVKGIGEMYIGAITESLQFNPTVIAAKTIYNFPGQLYDHAVEFGTAAKESIREGKGDRKSVV